MTLICQTILISKCDGLSYVASLLRKKIFGNEVLTKRVIAFSIANALLITSHSKTRAVFPIGPCAR